MDKIKAGSAFPPENEIMNQSVEEKVMNYMELHLTLDNVSVACRNLHCSRRQLQRVLKKLCEDKKS